jgi:uncharacterized membrane protein
MKTHGKTALWIINTPISDTALIIGILVGIAVAVLFFYFSSPKVK